MLPPFDLQGGAAVVAARGAAVTALLSAFGTIAFRVLVAPKALARMPPDIAAAAKRQLLWLAQLSIAAAALGIGVWLVVQTADIADANSLAAAFAAVPKVVGKTSFGHVIVLQLVVLFVLAAVVGSRDRTGRQRAALGVGIIAVALQSGHSHAFSMVDGPSLLLACDILHLIGAGAWLGGLVPLLLLVRMAPPKAAVTAARWFSPLGQWCIAALVVSATIQGWVLVDSIPGLVGTAYGWMALVKLVLFGVLLGFAWVNRYRFAPALLHDAPETARSTLVRSVALQTVSAVAIVVAAVMLSELPPAMHLQALWPFSARVSLAAVTEDPDFRREVLQAGSALAAAVAVLILTLLFRRFRLAAVVAVIVVGWFALPHLDVLFVTAYPTSFYRSPTGFTSAAIVEGAALYGQNCASCHGRDGGGDGPLAKTLSVGPADLTAAHLWLHRDGELFWWISHGMYTPEGKQLMPGFAGSLDDDSLWALIDYVRAANAGTAEHQTGEWPQPVQAPGFGVRCGARMMQLSDFRGRFVRLVIRAVPPAASPAVDVVTVVAAPPGGEATTQTCIARDETVPPAYAIISRSAVEAMTGVQFLIDGSGRLRAMQRSQGAGGWDDPEALRAEIVGLRAHTPTHSATAAAPMKMPM